MSETVKQPELTINSITVTTDKGETFEFRLPSARDFARIGARAYELRRQDSPTTGGNEVGLDFLTQDLYRGFALFEVLLIKADAKNNWPFSADETGQPVVRSDKFPPYAISVIPEVLRKFEDQVATFF